MEATAWAHLARQAALQQLPSAFDYSRRAWKLWDHSRTSAAPPPWSSELLAWQVRAALRQPAGDAQRWLLVTRAIDALPAAERRDGAWVYWKPRAALALAPPGPGGEAARAAAQAELSALAARPGFYGKLAAEELGLPLNPPPAPAALTAAEQEAARQHAGLRRALQLIALGLRSEGVREWNFSLRGLPERELLAAAQSACEQEVWDRCINTSERTRGEVDMHQRFPLPLREPLQARALASGLDPALLYGLIRQESRFVADIRSSVGAAGLMQLMPATARWTAKKVGLAFRPGMVTDTQVNLQLGAAYLRRVLDDFDGSLVLATTAYNAGPSRSRRWREGPAIEAVAWVESIPFNETRDYVKQVLSNQVDYAVRLGGPVPTLKSLLGGPIGPRPAGAAGPDPDLP
jgi:soluble lytic murein transglycosylase